MLGFDMNDVQVPEAFWWESYKLALATTAAVILLEYALWTKDWDQLYKSDQDIQRLYRSAIWSNAVNLLVNGPLAYGLVRILVEHRSCFPAWISVPGLAVLQGFGYATAHAWMHLPQNYQWTGHKYHHRYHDKTFVRPIVANSVTLIEFWLAYMLPIVVGVVVARPSAEALFWLTLLISVANLAIHTPPSVLPMADWLPQPWFVTNVKHFDHHQHTLRHFSAPIFDFDPLVSLVVKTKKRV